MGSPPSSYDIVFPSCVWHVNVFLTGPKGRAFRCLSLQCRSHALERHAALAMVGSAMEEAAGLMTLCMLVQRLASIAMDPMAIFRAYRHADSMRLLA
mmetsp:Transcript_44427/g.123534  ORF Transcript_44427/g.123534 Transcript_44427/m.123534 type:complete len:97 (+) Transcript_44427:52-342(+)